MATKLKKEDVYLKNFNDVIYNMALKLTEKEGRDIAMLYDLERHYRAADPLCVLFRLLERQIITQSNPESITEVFDRIKRKDLSKLAMKLINRLRKNKNKKSPDSQSNARPRNLEDVQMMQAAEFAFARMHLNTLAFTTDRLRLGSDLLEDALEKLSIFNKYLSQIETERGLPSTCHYVTYSFSSEECNSQSSSSGKSSLENSNCHDIDSVYESISDTVQSSYVVDEQEYTSVLFPNKQAHSPPLLVTTSPKQSTDTGTFPSRPTLQPTIVASSVVSVPLSMTHTATCSQSHDQRQQQQAVFRNEHAKQQWVESSLQDVDENTGDSGHGTGSGEDASLFPYVQLPLLKPGGPMGSKSKPPPPTPPAPYASQARYMKLNPCTAQPSGGYMSLQTKTTPTTDDELYSTPS